MPQSFAGLLLFALIRHGLRMKLKLQREREENWRAHNTKANHLLYTEHCREVNDLIRCAKENHFSSIIESNQGD